MICGPHDHTRYHRPLNVHVPICVLRMMACRKTGRQKDAGRNQFPVAFDRHHGLSGRVPVRAGAFHSRADRKAEHAGWNRQQAALAIVALASEHLTDLLTAGGLPAPDQRPSPDPLLKQGGSAPRLRNIIVKIDVAGPECPCRHCRNRSCREGQRVEQSRSHAATLPTRPFAPPYPAWRGVSITCPQPCHSVDTSRQ